MAQGDQRIIAYNEDWKVQTAIGTARAQADLNTAMQVEEISPWENVYQYRYIRDCSRQFVKVVKTQTRLKRARIRWEAVPHFTSGMWAMVLGNSAAATGTDPKVYQLTPLTRAQRNMKVMTIRYGFVDGVDNGQLVKDVAVNSIAMSANAGINNVVTCEAELLANAAFVDASAGAWPECLDETPILLPECVLTVDGDALGDELTSFRCSYSNAIPTGALHRGSSVDLKRMIRAAERPYEFAFALDGYPYDGSALDLLALANNDAGTEGIEADFQCGAAGNGFDVAIPNGQVKYQTNPEGEYSEARDLQKNLEVVPLRTGGDDLTPINVLATLPAGVQTGTFLATA
jgi:hypothetical protein